LTHPQIGQNGQLPDDFEIGHPSAERSRVASEIGAAMAHELNGPMTALLLYVGDIKQNAGRLIDTNGDHLWLEQVVDNAYREAERIRTLIDRMGDYFEAPIDEATAVAVGRDAIAWWSRNGGRAAGPRHRAGGSVAHASSRSGTKPLTPRELEVLGLVSEGYSNKEGAIRMNISYRTFECHRAQVMKKFGARNTAELVRLVLADASESAAPAQPTAI
jgi:DNA-binding CsgD family transcriptional regulator